MQGTTFRILIVEDDQEDREIIDEAFTKLNYQGEVKKVTNATALLDYLHKIEPQLYPSLIVLDNGLPGMDALSLLKVLKSKPDTEQIPVAVYSTLITETKKKQLLEAGAVMCMEKGVTMDAVIGMANDLKRLAGDK